MAVVIGINYVLAVYEVTCCANKTRHQMVACQFRRLYGVFMYALQFFTENSVLS